MEGLPLSVDNTKIGTPNPNLDDIMSGTTLPLVDTVGDSDSRWTIPIVDSDYEDTHDEANMTLTLTINGQFLGMGTTYRPRHNQHVNEYANTVDGEKCNACRWFELRLFYDDNDRRYVLHFAGRSVVPTEEQRFKTEFAYSAMEIIDILSSQPRGRNVRNEDGTVSKQTVSPDVASLTYPAIRALAQACGFDDDIKEAYISRTEKV
jgi:hypothetical protein